MNFKQGELMKSAVNVKLQKFKVSFDFYVIRKKDFNSM